MLEKRNAGHHFSTDNIPRQRTKQADIFIEKRGVNSTNPKDRRKEKLTYSTQKHGSSKTNKPTFQSQRGQPSSSRANAIEGPVLLFPTETDKYHFRNNSNGQSQAPSQEKHHKVLFCFAKIV
jgi:hypothetical protein